MQINSSTDYAVRILVFLGRSGRMVSAKEIAKEMDIPPKYVTPIITKLRNGGFVRSFQGSNGGYVLSELAQGGTLLDVINIMEREFMDERCCTCSSACLLYNEGDSCPVSMAYKAMHDAIQRTASCIMLGKMLSTKNIDNEVECNEKDKVQ